MIKIVKQIISFYLENNTYPTVNDLTIDNIDLLNKKEPLFVTLYKWGEVRGSAGSINSIKQNIIEELIDVTIHALSKDNRFNKLEKSEINDLNIRIDLIESREIIENIDSFNSLKFLKDWVIVIKKDYDNMVILLPNISNKIDNQKDYIDVLSKKLWEGFIFDNYIVYKINTKVVSDF